MSGLRLFSPHAAERELHVRHGSLAPLLKARKVRVVTWMGRLKIPAAEVERLAREGLTPTGRAPRSRHPRSSSNADPAAIRAIDLESL